MVLHMVPLAVAEAARRGLLLRKNGYAGGTATGWARAKQLATSKAVDPATLRRMRAWFARHGPDANNGGTSYPGYCRWLSDGAPTRLTAGDRTKRRGAVAWLLWGGDAAYDWLKTPAVRAELQQRYPGPAAAKQRRLVCRVRGGDQQRRKSRIRRR